MLCKSIKKLGKCLKKGNWEEYKKVEQRLFKQRDILNKKRKIFQDYAKKTLAINNLVARNKQRLKIYDSQRSEGQFLSQCKYNDRSMFSQSQTMINAEQEQIFSFPLIQISFMPEDERVKMHGSLGERVVEEEIYV